MTFMIISICSNLVGEKNPLFLLYFLLLLLRDRNVLGRGGTAVDSAIALLFCNGAVHSMSMGIGGGFIMTIYIKKEAKAYSLMARETAPKAAHRDMFINATKHASKRGW